MSDDHSFDFDDTTFERVEVASGVLLANAEVDYGELFTEVIWDGLITADKRDRLDRAAEVYGLDRDRVRRIEQALQAAYEARHRVRVEEEAPPSGTGVPFEGMAEPADAFDPPATAFRPTQPPGVPPGPRSSGDRWMEGGWSEPDAAGTAPVFGSEQGSAPRHRRDAPTPAGGFHVAPPPRLADVSWDDPPARPPPLPAAFDPGRQQAWQQQPPAAAPEQMVPPPEEAVSQAPELSMPQVPLPPASPPPPAAGYRVDRADEPPTPVGGFLAPTSVAPLGAEVRAGLEESRPSFSPFAPALDEPHLYALQRRIGFLESRAQELHARNAELSTRVIELERELDLSRRGSIDVEVNVASDPYAARSLADPAALHRAVIDQPRDPERTRALYRALKRASDADRRWCAAQVLSAIDPEATDEERQTYGAHRVEGLIKPARSMTHELWRSLLFHPDEDPLSGDIFSAIVPAVLLARASTQRRERNAPVLDPARRVDPAGSTIQAVRCVAWAAAILGMEPPPIYVEPDWPGMFETVVAVPPATRLGRMALSGRSASELAFAAGRHLSWYRLEHVIVKLTGSTRELEELFLAALTIGNPGLPIAPEVKERVGPVARAIEPLLEPPSIARLRNHIVQFIEQGGRTHLRRWAMAADRTAARAGLLLASDLPAARTMLELEDPRRAPDLCDDLIVFATSDRYTDLRQRIGIQVSSLGSTGG